MIDKSRTPGVSFPQVRNAFGMDINKQEYILATGLADNEEMRPLFCITQGEWSNNWVPDTESLAEIETAHKPFT